MCYAAERIQQLLQMPRVVVAKGVMAQLERAGFQAYLVGGAVRDALLGRAIGDIDLATSATPDEVQALFPHAVPTGLAHGTVTVVARGEPFEVTTFRQEGPYVDKRHPAYVHYVRDITDDLARRDFTINALACDSRGHLVDPFGGLADLQAGIVRAVGQPRDRFREDALRLLRALRFAAQLNFTIDRETVAAMRDEAASLGALAAERVRTELHKLLAAPQPGRVLQLLWTEQLLPHIAPLADSLEGVVHDADAHLGANGSGTGNGTRAFSSFNRKPSSDQLAQIENELDVALRWILFLRLCGATAGQARSLARALRMSRQQMDELAHIWQAADSWQRTLLSPREARAAAFAHGLARALRIVRLAHYFGQVTAVERQLLERQLCHADWELAVEQVTQLALDSAAMIRLAGRRPGPWLGRVRQALLEKVVAGEVVNDAHRLEREWRLHGPDAP